MNWTEEEWGKYVWSDECKVEKSKDPRTVWVFAAPNELWLPECVNPALKGPDTWLMVWGCIHGGFKGPFTPIIMNVNGKVYLKLLQHLLPPVYNKVKETYPDAIFMQDNARPHVHHLVKKWFADNNIVVDDWPPYSPDLNPIEQVWKRLKELLQKHHPYIAHMPGGPEAIQAKLAEILP